MSVPNLSDGTPLTFEWLNLVADTINRLDVAKNNDDSNVKFVGDISGSDVQVLTGSVPIDVTVDKAKAGTITKNNIKFKTAFADKNVTVVAMVTSSAAAQNDNPVAAAVSVGQITANNFDAVVQVFADSSAVGKKKLTLKYIAIGKKQV